MAKTAKQIGGSAMGACKTCGQAAGAMKSQCASCASKESTDKRNELATRKELLGPLDGVQGFDALFAAHSESVGRGIARLKISLPNSTNVLVDGGSLGVTSTGVAYSNVYSDMATFAPYSTIRDVAIGTTMQVGTKSSWGSTTVVSEDSIWFKFIYMDLNVSQFHFPVTRGNEATYVTATRWFIALNEFTPLTVNDSTVKYVWLALLGEPFNVSGNSPGRAALSED